MEISGKAVFVTGKRSGLGHCRHFFWLGVLFDAVGVAVLFTGVFADLLFYDMLLYLGAIIIFFSLLWWVSWYTGNVELLPEDALPGTSHTRFTSRMEVLRQSVGHRVSATVGSFTSAFAQARRTHGRRRRRSPRSILKASFASDSSQHGERRSEDTGKHVQDDTQGVKPEEDTHSKASGSLFLSPEAGGRTLLEWPVFPRRPLDQPLPFPVPCPRVHPVAPLVSVSSSESQSDDSLTPASFPLMSQPAAPEAVQSHPPVFSRGHFQVPVAAQSQLQDHPRFFQTQPPSVQASESQALATQVSLTPLTSTQSFPIMGIQTSPAIQDFPTVFHTEQISRSSFLDQEISRNKPSGVLEISKKLVAQVFETLPLSFRKISHVLPNTMPPILEITESASESQLSVHTVSTHGATTSQQSVLTISTDQPTVSQLSVPTQGTHRATESQVSVPMDSAHQATESLQSVRTVSIDGATASQLSVPTDSAHPATESQQSVRTVSFHRATESRQSVLTISKDPATVSQLSVPTHDTHRAIESQVSVPTDSVHQATESQQSVCTVSFDRATESQLSIPADSTHRATASQVSVPMDSAHQATESRQSVRTVSVNGATESQLSIPTDSAHQATEFQLSVCTVSIDGATASQQSVPTDSAHRATEPQQSVRTDSTHLATEPQQSVRTDSAHLATESQLSVPTDSARQATELQLSVCTVSIDRATESRQSPH